METFPRRNKVSWIFLLFLTFAYAAETELAPIVVEAIKDVERFSFTTSETLTQRELEAAPLGMIAPELEKTPGVIANQNGGPGGRVSFFIRGTESRHVSFTIDGLRINDTSNTDRQFDSAFLTAPFLRKITIHKGPQAVMYGSDALGGLIEMITRKGEDAPEGRISFHAGSFGTIGLNLTRDWEINRNQGTLTLSRLRSDGISRLNEKRFNAKERDATEITQITTSSTHGWAEKVKTDFLASVIIAEAEQDGFNSDNRFDKSFNDQFILQQKTSYGVSEGQIVSFRTGLSRHDRENRSLSNGVDHFDGNLLQNELLYRLEKGGVGFITGGAIEEEKAEFKSKEHSFYLHSLFAQAAYEKDLFKLHAGLRREIHSRYGDFLTGAAGIGYGDFYFQYSQGYKAPSLYQLFGPASFGSPVGNPDLEPETNHFSELVWKKEVDSFDGHVALFQNRLSNLFTYSLSRGYLNQQGFISEGLEVSGKWKDKYVHLFTSYVHQAFRKEKTDVLRRPQNTAQLGLSVFPQETLELSANAFWFSSRKDFGQNSEVVKLNPYEVINLGLRKVWPTYDLSIEVRNILDREYEELYGFSVLPRSLFLSFGHRF